MTKYTVVTKAYGKEPGETVTLDETDSLVQLNVAAGVLTTDAAAKDTTATQMTCPICATEMKRPPKFASTEELAEHYEDKHPAFAAPSWSADNNEG